MYQPLIYTRGKERPPEGRALAKVWRWEKTWRTRKEPTMWFSFSLGHRKRRQYLPKTCVGTQAEHKIVLIQTISIYWVPTTCQTSYEALGMQQ